MGIDQILIKDKEVYEGVPHVIRLYERCEIKAVEQIV